jgi:hypothetical protein
MRATTRQRTQEQLGASFGAEFHNRRGTSAQPFPQRLSRARLLHLRRRDTAANWLALTIPIALYFLLASSPAHANPMDGVYVFPLAEKSRVLPSACCTNSTPLSPRTDVLRQNAPLNRKYNLLRIG